MTHASSPDLSERIGLMGLASRDIAVQHDGHEIALSASMTGLRMTTQLYKLYLDGELVDEQSTTLWSALFGASATLRGKLTGTKPGVGPRRVKVVVKHRGLRRSKYNVFIDDDLVHEELATFGGL